MAEKIIFHLGAHRTGSTYTQSLFSENKTGLKEAGIFFECFQEVPDLQYKAFKARGFAQKGMMEKFAKEFEAVQVYFEELRKKNEVCFISYEGLLGHLNLASGKGIYRASSIIMKELNNILRKDDVVYVFCVRNYASFIESTYKFSVRQGEKRSFNKYFKLINPDTISWIRIVTDIIESVGEENVLIWSYEKFAENPQNVYEWVFNQSNVDSEFIRKLEISTKAENASASNLALKIMRKTNPYIKKFAKKRKLNKRKFLKKINNKVEHIFTVKRFGKPKLLTREQKEAFDKQYKEDLKVIQSILPGRCMF